LVGLVGTFGSAITLVSFPQAAAAKYNSSPASHVSCTAAARADVPASVYINNAVVEFTFAVVQNY
jgi:hypothetical protein